MTFLRIETIAPKILVGMSRPYAHAQRPAPELWRAFMPRRKEIQHVKSPDIYAVRIFEMEEVTAQMQPNLPVIRWAAVEVERVEEVPLGMDVLVLPAGNYAVFEHRGPARTFHETATYAYRDWLPNSAHLMDGKPHFEIMGPDYRMDDEQAREEMWVGVR